MAKALTKTANDAIQEIASALMVPGAARDISASLATRVFIDYAPYAETAASVGARAVVQISPETSGDEFWTDYYEFVSGLNTAASEAFTATEPAGETSIAVTSTTGLTAVGDKIFIKNTTLANSEWARIRSVTATPTIVLDSGLTHEQTAAASTIYNKAERWSCPLPIEACRYRVLMFAPTGPACVFSTYDLTMAL